MRNFTIGTVLSFVNNGITLCSHGKSLNSNFYPEGSLPLIIDQPRFSEQINLFTKKLTSGGISINISNTPYDGLTFYERLPHGLEGEQVYFYLFSNENLLMSYVYVIESYSLRDDVITIKLEDSVSQSTKVIPHGVVPESDGLPDKYKNHRIPFVYGTVEKAKCVLFKYDIGFNSGTFDFRDVQLVVDSRPILAKHDANHSSNESTKYPPAFLNTQIGDNHYTSHVFGFLYIYDNDYYRVPQYLDHEFDLSEIGDINYGNAQYTTFGDSAIIKLDILSSASTDKYVSSNLVANGYIFADIVRKPTSVQVRQNEQAGGVAPSLDLVMTSDHVMNLGIPGDGVIIEDDPINWDRFLNEDQSTTAGFGIKPHNHTGDVFTDDYSGLIIEIDFTQPGGSVKQKKDGTDFHRALLIADMYSYGLHAYTNYSALAMPLWYHKSQDQTYTENDDASLNRKTLYEDMDLMGLNFNNTYDCNISVFDLPYNFSAFSFYTLNGWEVPAVWPNPGGVWGENITDRWVGISNMNFISQVIKPFDFNMDFYAHVSGRMDIDGNLITTPLGIIKDIFDYEMQIDSTENPGTAIIIDERHLDVAQLNNLKLAFSWYKEISVKEFLEEFTKDLPIVGKFVGINTYRMLHIKSEWFISDIDRVINAEDVIEFSSKRTGISQSYNKCKVRYGYDQGKNIYRKELDVDISEIASISNYNNLNVSDNVLTIENKFINDSSTARLVANHNLGQFANRRTVLSIKLPVFQVVDFQLLDVVRFDKMVDGKIYNEDYTVPVTRNGQNIYPYFVITKIGVSKLLELELTQLHQFSDNPPIPVCNMPNYVEYLDPNGTGELINLATGQYTIDNSLCLTEIQQEDEQDPNGWCFNPNDTTTEPWQSSQSECSYDFRVNNTWTQGCTVPQIIDDNDYPLLALNFFANNDYGGQSFCIFQESYLPPIAYLPPLNNDGEIYYVDPSIGKPLNITLILNESHFHPNIPDQILSVPEYRIIIKDSPVLNDNPATYYDSGWIFISSATPNENGDIIWDTNTPDILSLGMEEMAHDGDPTAYYMILKRRNLAEVNGTTVFAADTSGYNTSVRFFNFDILEAGDAMIPQLNSYNSQIIEDNLLLQYMTFQGTFNEDGGYSSEMVFGDYINLPKYKIDFTLSGFSQSEAITPITTSGNATAFYDNALPFGNDNFVDQGFNNYAYSGSIYEIRLKYQTANVLNNIFTDVEYVQFADGQDIIPDQISIKLFIGITQFNNTHDGDDNIQIKFSWDDIDFIKPSSVYGLKLAVDNGVPIPILTNNETELALGNIINRFFSNHPYILGRMCTGNHDINAQWGSFVDQGYEMLSDNLDSEGYFAGALGNYFPEMHLTSIRIDEAKIGFSYYDISSDSLNIWENTTQYDLVDIMGQYEHGITPSLLLVAADYILGDINLDGQINVNDVVAIISHILGQTNITNNEFLADINQDGLININDILAMVNLIMDDSDEPEVIPGCMDIEAINYNPEATEDDGSCDYTPSEEVDFNLQQMIDLGADVTMDGSVNVTDIVWIVNAIMSSVQNDPDTYPSDQLPDLNQDESVNVSDIIVIINFIINGVAPQQTNSTVNRNLKKLRKVLINKIKNRTNKTIKRKY